MRIIELRAENIKKLSVVSIKPDRDLVEITGKNGSGKSSVLDSIWWALAGTKHIQSQPIHKGADTARIRLDMGEIVVTRKFSAGGSTIVVENADGARYPSPQKMLDDLIGALAFDPLAFTRMDARAQVEQLRHLVKLAVDLDAIDRANDADFKARTDVNRETARLQAQLTTIPIPPANLPDEAIDTAALVDEIAAAGEHNASIETRRANRRSVADRVQRIQAEIAEITAALPGKLAAQEQRRADAIADVEQQVAALQRRVAKLNEDADIERTTTSDEAADEIKALTDEMQRAQSRLDEAAPLPAPIDAAAVRQRLTDAAGVNAWIARRTERRNLDAAVKASQAKADALTAAMDGRKAEKTTAIAAAEMPVAGLGFGEGEVLFNGLPFDQASSAEQLRVSCAIAMAMNPRLRVLRIKDGSLLDDEGLRILSEMAGANDFQVWLEKVDTTGKVGIVMDDGQIAGAVSAEAAE